MSHLRGPLNLGKPQGEKNDPDKMEWSLSSLMCRFENTGGTACHKLFILLENVCKCWIFWHDLEMRLNTTRALETPPSGKFVMLERKQQIRRRISRLL